MLMIKPLSINEAFNGRRTRSKEYNQYIKSVMTLLPKNIYIPKDEIYLEITFGFSSRGSDLDNYLKPFIDVLQKKYKFNDNTICEISAKKKIVKKGEEFIIFYLNDSR